MAAVASVLAVDVEFAMRVRDDLGNAGRARREHVERHVVGAELGERPNRAAFKRDHRIVVAAAGHEERQAARAGKIGDKSFGDLGVGDRRDDGLHVRLARGADELGVRRLGVERDCDAACSKDRISEGQQVRSVDHQDANWHPALDPALDQAGGDPAGALGDAAIGDEAIPLPQTAFRQSSADFTECFVEHDCLPV